jgi:multicomponent K+:H+ antiporter subunit E
MIRRLFPHPVLAVLIVIVWMLLLNNISIGGLLVGMAVALIVPQLTAPFWPNRPKLRFGWRLLEYLAIVVGDIVVANFQVALLILFRPSSRLRSRWLVVPLDIHSPEAITMLAGTISLTPGTVSADVSADGHSLLVHALDAADPQAEIQRIKDRYEARLKRIFR